MELLQSEQKALDMVKRLGQAEATKRLDKISARAQARLDRADKQGTILSGFSAINVMTEHEKEETYLLGLGLGLISPDPVAEARQRVVKRGLKRQLNRLFVKNIRSEKGWSEETTMKHLTAYVHSRAKVSLKDWLEAC